MKRPELAPTEGAQTPSTTLSGLTNFSVTAVEGPGAGETLPVILMVWFPTYADWSVDTLSEYVVCAAAPAAVRTRVAASSMARVACSALSKMASKSPDGI